MCSRDGVMWQHIRVPCVWEEMPCEAMCSAGVQWPHLFIPAALGRRGLVQMHTEGPLCAPVSPAAYLLTTLVDERREVGVRRCEAEEGLNLAASCSLDSGIVMRSGGRLFSFWCFCLRGLTRSVPARLLACGAL